MTVSVQDHRAEQVRLARYLATRICDGAAGRLAAECTHNPPRDTYFIGSLRPVPPLAAGTAGTPQNLPDEVLRKIAPSAFGIDARLHPAQAQINLEVALTWACYHRLRPAREDQMKYQGVGAAGDGSISNQSAPTVPAAAHGVAHRPPGQSSRRRRDDTGGLFPRYRKLVCSASAMLTLRRAGAGWSCDTAALRHATLVEIARAQSELGEMPDRLRWSGTQQRGVPLQALANDAEYERFWSALPDVPAPGWAWDISAVLRPADTETGIVLELEAANRSTVGVDDWRYEGFFFDVRLEVAAAPGLLQPFELDLIPRGFRYDRNMWGRGFNCGVERRIDASGRDVLKTCNAPLFEQPRLITRNDPPATFEALARDPIGTLETIGAAMHKYDTEWSERESEYRATLPDWDASYSHEYAADRRKFEHEMVRFDRGMALIRSDPDVRLAFQLANQSFAGNPQRPAWRLFQIVFLVSQIPGLAALKTGHREDLLDRQQVDIIYFPTGGGKTEAYLGVIAFQLFLDRLRGKTAGVSVWTRFPLRLLTLQQTQRAADVVGAAELVRRHHTDRRLAGPNVDGFAIGYLAGQEATPNEFLQPSPGGPPNANWSIALDPQARQRWKKVVRCPACKTANVQVDFDPQTVRLSHRCKERSCPFPNGELPVYVVDNDLFRYLPSVVVGTIDKLASLGNQRKMALLLGRVTGRCRIHGYCCQECCQRGCRDAASIAVGVPAGISGPTLFIQDELHLLKEGLGTFDAHYETFVQELLHNFGQAEPLKIIASSATIEAFERQSEHLYGRPARVFPGHGPRLGSSFYAVAETYPQRLYLGVLPHNKTIHNAMLELLEAYQREIHSLRALKAGSPNPYGGRCDPGTEEWQTTLDPYRTSLCYFSATRELSSLRTDLDAHSSPILEEAEIEPFRIEELSGSTSTDTVTRTLERLERGDHSDGLAPNLVLATSMISHGVDIDRMNAMFLFGMPRQNAEYIQASSRVGRTHCGIVFTCMKPARERDQSHFAYFVKYHQFLGRLVEPVAINRWSKFALQRTLPGLFMGVLLQEIANGQQRPGMFTRVDFVRKLVLQGGLKFEDFLDILERAYLVKDNQDTRSTEVREEIRRRVSQFRDQILAAGATAEWVSDALLPSPMRSLREVDEQITIELDSNGSAWAETVPNTGE